MRRLPPSGRADKELFGKFVGLPWDTKSTLRGPRRLAVSGGGDEAKAAGKEEEQAKEIPSTPGGRDIPSTPGGLEIPRTPGAGQAAPGTPRAPASPSPRRDRDQARAEQMDQEDAAIARSSKASSSKRPMQAPVGGGTQMDVTAEEAETSAQKREPETTATEDPKEADVHQPSRISK